MKSRFFHGARERSEKERETTMGIQQLKRGWRHKDTISLVIHPTNKGEKPTSIRLTNAVNDSMARRIARRFETIVYATSKFNPSRCELCTLVRNGKELARGLVNIWVIEGCLTTTDRKHARDGRCTYLAHAIDQEHHSWEHYAKHKEGRTYVISYKRETRDAAAVIVWENDPRDAYMLRLTRPLDGAEIPHTIGRFATLIRALEWATEEGNYPVCHLQLVWAGNTLAEGSMDAALFDSMLDKCFRNGHWVEASSILAGAIGGNLSNRRDDFTSRH